MSVAGLPHALRRFISTLCYMGQGGRGLGHALGPLLTWLYIEVLHSSDVQTWDWQGGFHKTVPTPLGIPASLATACFAADN